MPQIHRLSRQAEGASRVLPFPFFLPEVKGRLGYADPLFFDTRKGLNLVVQIPNSLLAVKGVTLVMLDGSYKLC